MRTLSLPEITYRPDIDGLRAVAVLPVVFYHAGIEVFSGGYVGVDVFFVISGYLITSIIAGDVDTNHFSYREFYVRRARRLFPALFAVLAFACLVGPFLLIPEELENLGQSAATTALFSSNILFFTEAGYFTGSAETKPLLHTWSLAIEEQYYLLFPGFLILVRKHLQRRYLRCILVLFTSSFIFSLWSMTYAPDASFYLLPSRTWELLLGSLLALTHFTPTNQAMREWGSVTGLALILIAAFGYTADTPFPGTYATLPCFGTALIILCGRGATPTLVSRLLSLRSIVFFGLVSYSLYLWHWPILVFARHYLLRELLLLESVALIITSIVVAVASWRLIERPFRGRNKIFTDPGLLRFSIVLIVCAVGAGLVFDLSEGLPERMPEHAKRIADVANDRPARRKQCEGIAPDELSYQRVCRLNEVDLPPSVAVWGDSHAMAVMPVTGQAMASVQRNGLNFTSNGCAPLLGVSRQLGELRETCLAFSEKVISIITEHPELDTIILQARWARHGEGTPFGNERLGAIFLADHQRAAQSVAQNRAIFRQAMFRTLERLTALGRRIVIIGPIPEIGEDMPNVLAKAAWRGQAKSLSPSLADFHKRQAFVLETLKLASERYPVELFLTDSYFCNESHCADVAESGLPLYSDNNHVSSLGAARLLPMFERIFATSTSTSATN